MTDGDRGRGHVDVDGKARLAHTAGQTEPFALTDGDQLDRGHGTDDDAFGVDDLACRERQPIAEERAAPTGGRDEAHVLAVGLGCGTQPAGAGLSAHLILGGIAEGKQQPRQLGLREHVQHVALILGGIGTAPDRSRPVDVRHDASVMTGSDELDTEHRRALQQAIELEMAIAFDTRVRRTALRMCIDIGGHDVTLEVVREVEHVMVNTELLRYTTRVVDIGHRTAPGIALAAPQLHGDADNTMAALEQHCGSDRRVDPA